MQKRIWALKTIKKFWKAIFELTFNNFRQVSNNTATSVTITYRHCKMSIKNPITKKNNFNASTVSRYGDKCISRWNKLIFRYLYNLSIYTSKHFKVSNSINLFFAKNNKSRYICTAICKNENELHNLLINTVNCAFIATVCIWIVLILTWQMCLDTTTGSDVLGGT